MLRYLGQDQFLNRDETELLMMALYLESVQNNGLAARCVAIMDGKQPKVIEFRNELPKTPVGKILRRELREK